MLGKRDSSSPTPACVRAVAPTAGSECHEGGLLGGHSSLSMESTRGGGTMFVGLDLSRKRVDVVGLGGGGDVCWLDAVAPDRDGLAALVDRCPAGPAEVVAAVESMTGARFVHDELERRGWDVRIADARRAKGIAPLACKTDRVDARV